MPNAQWETIRTAHFRITFTPELTEQARRAAINAERAYAGLSRELVRPRGTIDLVLADNADYVNGYATPFPTNRIVVYAHPSSDDEALRNYSDWNELVVTHELTHIFHLDRVRGVWAAGQAIFGRNPLLFPNVYEPSWVTEGLAVYYESRLTGAGRLESGSHLMTARAAALTRELPHLDQLSRGTSRYPGGEVVYVYGSLLFDYLSRTTDPRDVGKFVETSSGSLIPFFTGVNSKLAFGISFESAWRRWRDSLVANLPGLSDPPGWRDLTVAGRTAFYPRWSSDSTIDYASSKGKEIPALYSVDLSGRERSFGRRNGVDVNVRSGGLIHFTQPDLTTPYEERSDLWMQRGDRQWQLTHGARLHSIDARHDGEIVAIQNTPASTRLVRVGSDGKSIAPIAEGSLDTQWSDPRWSRDGARIAVVRLHRGRSEIVILDSAGRELSTIAGSTAITASPVWSPDGRFLYFSSELSGASQLYAASLESRPAQIRRLTSVATGIFQPDISPDGRSIAATIYRGDGYHIGVFPVPAFAALPAADSVRVSPRAQCADCVSALARSPGDSSAMNGLQIKSYSAFPTILPHYWLPIFQSSSDNGSGLGLETSGSDLVGRHAYDAQLLHNTTHGENSAWLYYQYAGLGTPAIGFTASQSYSRDSLFQVTSTTRTHVGDFVERSRIASVQAVFARPRVRTYAALAIGAELERKAHRFDLDTVLPGVSTLFQKELSYPAIYLSGNWSNARRPALSISPEDGINFSSTVRQRWQTGDRGYSSRSAAAALSTFKSLDLPGFAHHVLAFHIVGGIADDRTPDRYSAGGVNGSSLALITGYGVGGQRREFGVRGYPAGAEQGIRAISSSLEYRAPLFAPSRGFRFLPLFIDKVSALAFADAGRAYCPAAAVRSGTACAPSDVGNPWMASVGAELNLDTGIQLDVPARLRLGVAIPTVNRRELRAPAALLFATFGSSF